ncbi:MAG: CRISPR-associated helicase Cas3' [Desulfosarcinaceae bacterium]
MDRRLAYLWAKTQKNDGGKWHPLILHLLDVAACTDAILAREPETTRNLIAGILGLPWAEARPWILSLCACHDLGKACPGFQCKWSGWLFAEVGLELPRSANTKINHAFVSQIALTEFLLEKGWSEDLAELAADAVGCHHGERANPILFNRLSGERAAIGNSEWNDARRDIMESVFEVFSTGSAPEKQNLSGPEFMLLAGLTSFADWIGSNVEWFPFGTVENCADLKDWFAKRRKLADHALDGLGWQKRDPLSKKLESFESVFGFTPRPLQKAMETILPRVTAPAILLVEAPMGEGKTEAAFLAHMALQRRFGHRGLYVALPTKATGNAMFERTLHFLTAQGRGRNLDIQLLHGASMLNDSFQNLRLAGIHGSESRSEIRAAEWFTHKKRALLSEYGVGTVDQALLPILPVRHNFVRLWGLANRVVVFDEIHAYDAYTGTLLIYLLRWLLALGSSVVLLSATLPPIIRRKLAQMVGGELPDRESEYPRLSIFQQESVVQIHFDSDPTRRRELRLKAISPDLTDIRAALEDQLAKGGLGLALVNTVQRAQDLYALFGNGEPLFYEGQKVGKHLPDGTEVFLFHARFPADKRQKREENVLKSFGLSGERNGRKILIATQVAEQSLDLDFDLMVTDLAPIDLVLQRAGRLWRHERTDRPVSGPVLIIAGLAGDEPPSFEKPLWWNCVYREDLLFRTWSLLHERSELILPDEIDPLVQAVYDEQGSVPDSIQDLLDDAMMKAEGDALAKKIQAAQAIIGFPDDTSWNDPGRFVLYDEDEPGVHRTLLARTRLGEESVVTIPLWPEDQFKEDSTPHFGLAKRWIQRAVSLSRKNVVKRLQEIGVPVGWKDSPLLRNCFPLLVTVDGCWTEDNRVRLDEELGIVYEPKEAE